MNSYEVIKLPSNGHLNVPETCLVKPLTAVHEEQLATSSITKHSSYVHNIIQSCVPDIDITKLCQADYDAIILAIRIITYGNVFKAKSECPWCKHENSIQLKLSDLEENKIDISDMVAPNIFQVTLPKTNHTIRYQILSMSGYTYDLNTIINMVIDINGDSKNKSYVLSNLPIYDFKYLKQHIINHVPMIHFKHEISCSGCNATYISPLSNDYKIFGITSEYKTKLFDELFDIIHYSNGNYNWNDLLTLPVPVRKKIGKMVIEKYNESIKQNNNLAKNIPRPPTFSPRKFKS